MKFIDEGSIISRLLRRKAQRQSINIRIFRANHSDAWFFEADIEERDLLTASNIKELACALAHAVEKWCRRDNMSVAISFGLPRDVDIEYDANTMYMQRYQKPSNGEIELFWERFCSMAREIRQNPELPKGEIV